MLTLTIPSPREPGDMHWHSPLAGFPGLAKIWVDRGYCRSKPGANPFYWVGDTLLYHWPSLEWMQPGLQYSLGLFANSDLPVNWAYNRHWTFWPRHPGLVEQYFAIRRLLHHERKYQCIWIGGYENRVQRGYRDMAYWRKPLDFCDIGIRGGNISPPHYMRLIRQARFGLCLPGYGKKCCREIELMAVGTVPIITPGVSLDYFDPPVVGKHCLLARNVEELEHLINHTSPAEWSELSWQAQDWYNRNASPKGSFDTTARIIKETWGT